MKQQLITARAATLLAALVVTGMATAAQAQSEQANETTTTLENVTAKDAPVKKEGEQDVDEVITNRKLRAETGSKSKFSFCCSWLQRWYCQQPNFRHTSKHRFGHSDSGRSCDVGFAWR